MAKEQKRVYLKWTDEQLEKIEELIGAGVTDPVVYENSIEGRTFDQIKQKSYALGLTIKKHGGKGTDTPLTHTGVRAEIASQKKEHPFIPIKKDPPHKTLISGLKKDFLSERIDELVKEKGLSLEESIDAVKSSQVSKRSPLEEAQLSGNASRDAMFYRENPMDDICIVKGQLHIKRELLGKGKQIAAPDGDVVLKPSHYNDGFIEDIDKIRDSMTANEFAGFCKGSALSYIMRERLKGETQDIRKAIWFLEEFAGKDHQ